LPAPTDGWGRPLWLANLSLGLLGIIRTFLSWSVVLDVEGFWPWNGPKAPREPWRLHARAGASGATDDRLS
jgi:hypothetical protein